jgi:hypothetical protein
MKFLRSGGRFTMVQPIQRTEVIEDLIRSHPQSVAFMLKKGLPCFVCGEPTWGTFEEVARRSGKSDAEIDALLEELASLLSGGGG